MGNLLRILLNDKPSKHSDNLFVDFENVQPTQSELRVWELVKTVLESSQNVLRELQNYNGATEEIRMAISNPGVEDLQERAWQSVTPLVSKLRTFFQFSLELERIIPELLGELCSDNLTPKEHLEQQQALFKQFAEILDFVLKFDDLKMTTPAIQNDFSYYRRTLSRMKMANEDEIQTGEERVSNELANRMSLFYAQATPMLKALSDVTSRFVTQDPKEANQVVHSAGHTNTLHVLAIETGKRCFISPIDQLGLTGHFTYVFYKHKDLPLEQTTDCLSMMAKLCRVMIENPEHSQRLKEETKLFCLRVMVGVIILYDHVHPVGAFAKTSSIEIKSSIKILKEQDMTKVESLLNALRYTTKHLQDEATSKSIKALLNV